MCRRATTRARGTMEAAEELGFTVWPTLYRVLRAVVGLPPLLLILSLCWYHWKYHRILSAASKLPTEVPTLPIVGHAHHILYGATEVVMLIIRTGKATVAKGMKTVCLWLGPYPVFFVQAADDIHTVITSSKTSEKSGEYDFLRFALGNGLLIAPGHVHRVTRRHVNPLFAPRNLEKLMAVFNQSGRLLVQDLSRHVGGDQLDVLPLVTNVAMRNVSCVLFGPDVIIDTQSDEFKGLLRAVTTIAQIEANRFFKIWLWSESVFRLLWRREINDIHDCWQKFSQGPLKAMKTNINSQGQEIDNNDNVLKNKDDSAAPLTLPDTYRVLRQNHPEFREQDLQNEMLTLVVTGTDSTKSLLSSCLLSLAAHPDIQEQLYQEIVSVTGPGDSEVTAEDIHSMPYLDMVLKESLRKYSIIPVIMRRAKEDIRLNDCTVPAGATIGVSLLSIHFDPEVFPDPEKFDPERFSPENMAKMKKYTYLPFSGGSRNCIGKTYASMLTKTAIVHVLRRYRLSTIVDITNLRYTLALALVSEDGYRLKLEERT